MKKRLISVFLSCCMIFTILPLTTFASTTDRISENEKAKAEFLEIMELGYGISLLSLDAGYISNEYIEAYIDSNGQFTMGTVEGDLLNSSDNNQKLLFGHPSPWSSETLVRIDGIDYLFNDYVTDVTINNDQAIATAIINEVTVEQILTLTTNPYTNLDDVVSINYTYTNNSSTLKQIGIRIMLDTMLGSNDGAPFRVNGADVTTEVEYVGNNIPQYWQSFDSLENPNVTATGFFYYTTDERPDKVQFAHWGSIYGSTWDYSITNGKAVTGDSAVAVYFNPKIVPTGGSNSVVTYYGISGFAEGNTDLTEPLAVRITAPSSLFGSTNGGYLNNPFDVSVYLSNVGNTTLTNVRAVLSLNGAPQLTLDSSQATTISVGDMPVAGTNSIQWTIRAIPQGGTTTADYSISFYSGNTLLKTMPLPSCDA